MDFVAHVAYNVVLITKQGLPDGLEMISDPADPRSSPLGWHDDGQNKMTVTAYTLHYSPDTSMLTLKFSCSGNNVIAFRLWPK